jgi:hypothetical protein
LFSVMFSGRGRPIMRSVCVTAQNGSQLYEVLIYDTMAC